MTSRDDKKKLNDEGNVSPIQFIFYKEKKCNHKFFICLGIFYKRWPLQRNYLNKCLLELTIYIYLYITRVFVPMYFWLNIFWTWEYISCVFNSCDKNCVQKFIRPKNKSNSIDNQQYSLIQKFGKAQWKLFKFYCVYNRRIR